MSSAMKKPCASALVTDKLRIYCGRENHTAQLPDAILDDPIRAAAIGMAPEPSPTAGEVPASTKRCRGCHSSNASCTYCRYPSFTDPGNWRGRMSPPRYLVAQLPLRRRRWVCLTPASVCIPRIAILTESGGCRPRCDPAILTMLALLDHVERRRRRREKFPEAFDSAMKHYPTPPEEEPTLSGWLFLA